MASLLEQAFQKSSCDLYADVLHVDKSCTPAQLRKAYYKQALQYHPDKNDTPEAKLKFQAISWAYNYLKDPIKRKDYDEEGILPRDDQEFDDDDDNDDDKSTSWKDYFDTIFGKLSVDDIDNFATKYKMSEEEERDVLEHYVKCRGDLVQMLEFVMLSEERDVSRWMEDYIQPAIAAGKVEPYEATTQKALATIEKKLMATEKKSKNKEVSMNDFDPDETETEESDNDNDDEEEEEKAATKSKKKKAAAAPAKKAKPTQAKKKNSKKKNNSSSSSEQDLIAMIRNKQGRGNPLASIAARYGVSNVHVDDDPLDDAAFAKLQSKMKKKQKK